jgi:hypothetical protein
MERVRLTVEEARAEMDAWAREHNEMMAARAKPGFWAWVRERMRDLAAYRADLDLFAAEYQTVRQYALPDALPAKLEERRTLANSRLLQRGGQKKKPEHEGLLERFDSYQETYPHTPHSAAVQRVAYDHAVAYVRTHHGEHYWNALTHEEQDRRITEAREALVRYLYRRRKNAKTRRRAHST